MTNNLNEAPEGDMVEVFTPFITKNGKRIFKKDGGLFHFYVPREKYRQS
ncbi:hypothetical protein AAEK50_004571 [Serratia marcescens]|nr:hypothetical protein [Serratia marcescens]HEJ0019603.1 hypothetical protein [Serratia marcescens]